MPRSTCRYHVSVLLIGLFCTAVTWAEVATPLGPDQLQPLVEQTLQTDVEQARLAQHPGDDSVLTSFYKQRNFTPAWLTGASWQTQVKALLTCLEAAGTEGLDSDLYHLDRLHTLVATYSHQVNSGETLDPYLVASLDILLTEAFLQFGSHLASGRVDPTAISEEWTIRTRSPLLIRLLAKALAEGRVAEVLAYLRPSNPEYQKLRQAYRDHRRIQAEGGWSPLPEGTTLKPGESDPRVSDLRIRLAASGDLPPAQVTGDEFYDSDLEKAVRKFQARHGLHQDGLIGERTLTALNVPAAFRAEQIALNLERWRWLPRLFRPDHIVVNIADFSLALVNDGTVTSTMRVVVGKKERPTPIISGELTYLELNPYWNIPQKLAQDDILPLVSSDPEYLDKQRIRVFSSWSPTAAELTADSIDWVNLTPANFAYKLRQDPGPANALGRIKFIFHNKRSVYLHDTPARHLFNRSRRSFSSGCVRVEKPIELAEALLQNNPGWTREKILAAIAEDETKAVDLPHPIPIYLLYWTAWVDADGEVQFRDDIYDYDKVLQTALSELQAPSLRILSPAQLTRR